MDQDTQKTKEEFLRKLYDTIPDVIFSIDMDGNLHSFNSAFENITGFPRTMWINKSFLELLHQDDHKRAIDRFTKVKEGADLPAETYRIKNNQSAYVHIEIISTRYKLSDGEEGVIGIARDIESRMEQDRKIHLRTAALDTAADGVVVTDSEGTVIWCNKHMKVLTGYEPSELIGGNPRTLKSGKHTEEFYKMLWDTIKSGNVWTGQVVNKRKDGSLYTEEMRITPVDFDGKKYFIAIKHDISARIEAEDKLRKQEELYRAIYSSFPGGLVRVDEKGIVLEANERLLEWTRKTIDKVKGTNFFEAADIDSSDRDSCQIHFKNLTEGKDQEGCHVRMVSADSPVRYIHMSGKVVHVSPEVTQYLIVMTDITSIAEATQEEKRRRKELEKLNDLMVNREHRMIELKNELKKLQSKLSGEQHENTT